MDPGKVTGRLDHNVLVVNHLGRHRDFNHPQILLRTQNNRKLYNSLELFFQQATEAGSNAIDYYETFDDEHGPKRQKKVLDNF